MKEKPLTEFMGSKKGAKEHKEKPAKPKVAGLKGPWKLPEGWRWVRLGDVAGIRGNSGVKKKLLQFNSIAFIPMELIPEKGVFSRYELRESTNIKSYSYAEPGDILLAKITPSFENGKQGIVPKNVPNNFALATTEVYPIYIENNLLDRMYLFYILKSKYARKTLEDQMLGTTGRQRVPKEAVLKLKIPLPPLEEQKRIVAKLDEISKRLEEAKRHAREAREEAEKLMASALHEVFSKAEEMGWEWVRLGEIARHEMGGTPRKDNREYWENGEIPWITASEIPTDSKYVTTYRFLITKKALEESNTKLAMSGDILLVTTASIGKIAIASFNVAVNQQITIISTKNEEKAKNDYLYYAIKYFFPIEFNIVTRGAAQLHINQKMIKRFKIALPPLEEQKRIVTYLDAVSERAQKLVRLYGEREKELEQLFPAILDRAFRGEL
ncbi:restriction endonuclease subunit S [Thermococcus radiotolerans]|uniref:Type I restriction modification DNA specificity domain-containing protein n=1 Tax=Thermococcus radiotolerans TaxID=187880 RepID=A0A2Z2MZ41_9EURY|nr:restriction endonuclease subunit S [Thermococcus radiotolerans]ASJ15075.1 hypothetical protein A3L10_08020 [Thermococcus radiotolerans]